MTPSGAPPMPSSMSMRSRSVSVAMMAFATSPSVKSRTRAPISRSSRTSWSLRGRSSKATVTSPTCRPMARASALTLLRTEARSRRHRLRWDRPRFYPCTRRSMARFQFLADVEHRRLIFFAFADDDGSGHVDIAEDQAHRIDGGSIDGDRRSLRCADEFELDARIFATRTTRLPRALRSRPCKRAERSAIGRARASG